MEILVAVLATMILIGSLGLIASAAVVLIQIIWAVILVVSACLPDKSYDSREGRQK